MIRLLHFADVHLGIENYGRVDPNTSLNSRVIDFLRRLDEMIAYAKVHEVDIAVFAGDAFKNRQPNPTLQREFAWRVRDLADICPVVLLIGNHDLPATLQRASSVEIYDTLNVPNVLVGADYELYHVETKSGAVEIATAPYPTRAVLLDDDAVRGKTMAQLDALLQEKLQLVLRDLAQQAAQSPVPRVLVGHFSVSGAIYGSERGIMTGRDATVLLSELADPAWDYVALGHIHKHQNLTVGRLSAPPVVYSGSLERIDFGEEDDAKGFCWVEMERGQTSWQFVPLTPRRFLTLRLDVRHSDNPMQKILESIAQANVEEAIVRLIVQADVEAETKIRESEIQKALYDAKASVVAGIQKEVERPVRSRFSANPEGWSSSQLLKHYLETKKVAPDRITVLLERAEGFFNDGNAPLPSE